MGKFRSQVSPAMVVALLALIVALGGTAIAATNALSGKQKRETGRIAGKVFNKRIGGAGVAHAGSADTATKANTANSAELATKATDAERLAGVAAGEYQHKLREQCPAPESISTIDQQGVVTCNTTAVKPVHRLLNPSEQFVFSLGNNLQLLVTCHDGGNTELHFQNLGTGPGRLGWFYGSGATSVGAGTTVAGESESDTSFSGREIDGQFVWSIGEGVDTVNLRAVDNTTSCEVAGTVISAIG